MKTIAIVFALMCAAAAQNAPLPTQTFSFQGAPISLPGYNGTFVGTDAGMNFWATPNFALSETNIVSSDAKFKFFAGGAATQFPYLSKWLNDRTTYSGFRVIFGLRGYVGSAQSAQGDHIGAMIQGTINYSLDSGGHYQLGANIGAARFPGFASGWTSVIEIGPKYSF